MKANRIFQLLSKLYWRHRKRKLIKKIKPWNTAEERREHNKKLVEIRQHE